MDNLDEVILKIDVSNDLKENFNLLQNLCTYLVRNNQKLAPKYLQTALHTAQTAQNDDWIGSILIQNGNLNYFQNQFKLARKFYLEAKPYLKANHKALGTIFNNLGILASYDKSMNQSISYLEKAIEHRLKANLFIQAMTTKANIATVVLQFGEHDLAIKYYFEILKELQNQSDNDIEIIKLNTHIFSGLSNIYFNLKDYEKAADYQLKVVENALKVKKPLQLGMAYQNYATMLRAKADYKLALEYNQMAIVELKKADNDVRIFEALGEQGNILKKIGKFQKAVDVIGKAIDKMKVSEKRNQLPGMYVDLAECYLELNQLDKAIEFGTYSVEELKGRDLKFAEQRTFNFMSEVYAKTNNHKEAYSFLKKFLSVNTQLDSELKQKTIAELEAKYDSAKKEQQAQQLELEKVNFEQKALRAQMNPHFIFNTLNSIKKYVDVQDNKTASTYLVSFSKLMRRILENSDDEFVLMEDVIDFLKEYIRLEQLRCNYSFTYQIIVDDEVEEDIMKIPSMIVQPYLENAILHGIAGVADGRIEMQFNLFDEETICCKIIDNGKGIDSLKEKSFQSQHRSMGTKITQERITILAHKHNKQVKVEKTDLSTKDSTGTEVKIYLPIL